MSNPSLSMLEEYEVIFEELGEHGAAFWKFFDLFKVILDDSGEEGLQKGVYYAKDAVWTFATDDQLKQLRSYLKEQRKWIKKMGKTASPTECRRRLWFWCSRLKEWRIFDMKTRHDINYWFDTCEERIMEVQKIRQVQNENPKN